MLEMLPKLFSITIFKLVILNQQFQTAQITFFKIFYIRHPLTKHEKLLSSSGSNFVIRPKNLNYVSILYTKMWVRHYTKNEGFH